MFHFPVTPLAFEAIREELGPDRSPLAPIRTAAHAACARHARRAPATRRPADAILAAVLGGRVTHAPAPGTRHRH